MNRPSPRTFADAPLFLPYDDGTPPPDGFNYAATDLLLDGFLLTREALDGPGMRFKLEGHAILDVVPRVEDGVPTWVGTSFDGTTSRIRNMEATAAAAEFASMIHMSLRQRVDSFVFYMEERGVQLNRAPIEADLGVAPGMAGVDDEDGPDHGGELAEHGRRFGAPVRIVRDGLKAWVEGRATPEPWGRVREAFARAAEDGSPLCPASLPITRQIDVLERREGDVSRHRADLRSLRQMIGNPAEIMDMGLRAGVHVFDMVDSDRRDPVMPQAAITAFRQAQNESWERQEAHQIAVYEAELDGVEPPEAPQEVAVVDPTELPVPRQARRPIRQAFREATGFDAGSFDEVRAMPTYAREQMRAIGREFLAPHLGDMPMERVVVGRPSSGDPEAYAAFMEYFREGELVKSIGEFTHPSMPGYRTSPAETRRRDGWDAIVFSDFAGTYAYCFPSPIPENDLDAEAEPEPRAFGM